MTTTPVRNTGPVAVITGASSGIGEATARALAASGHRLALLARRADRIKALADELGSGSIAIQADVTDRDSLASAAGLAAIMSVDNEVAGQSYECQKTANQLLSHENPSFL